MWTGILAFFNGLLDVTSKFLSTWHDSQERQAGRDEVNLKDSQRTVTDLEKANAIDSAGAPADRGQLLDELLTRPKDGA